MVDKDGSMGELVVLSLGPGNFDDGFPAVTARLGEPGNLLMQFTGSLPPAPEIPQLYRDWQLLYQVLNQSSRSSPSIEIAATGVTNVSEGDFRDVCQCLENSINSWLSCEEFHRIEVQLRTQLAASDSVRLVIESDDEYIWRLPWQLWRFFQDYPKVEVSLSSPEYPAPPRLSTRTANAKVRILAILGSSKGIDLKRDQDLLQQLPGVEVKFLVQPQRQELTDELWEQGWDFLFFAGHGCSENNATTGRLYLNQNPRNNSLTIEELKEALSKAIARGLQLAVFNSCDGLGLARQLAAAGIPLPTMIVMREPVVDQVAQEFLAYFLRAFTFREPFHLAVRQARERLRSIEDTYPSASWLPVICQHPAVLPPTLPFPTPVKNKIVPQKQKRLVVAGMFLVGCLSSYLFGGPQLASLASQQGLKNHDEGQLLPAQQYYHLATLLDWQYAQPHYNLGWLCDESLDDTACAIKAYHRAALRGLSEAWAELARLHIKNNHTEAALKAIKACLAQTKYDAVKAACLKNRGWIRWQQQRLDEAEADLRKAIALYHDSPHSHCLLAQVLQATGRQQEAMEAWKYTIKHSEYPVPEQDACTAIAKQRLPGEADE
ncbi:MAG: CHAT domain-containing protein [Symploca sp. SIO2E6]|nr:CHAT domain-containing protein [Symploca sp. SIO2E6]